MITKAQKEVVNRKVREAFDVHSSIKKKENNNLRAVYLLLISLILIWKCYLIFRRKKLSLKLAQELFWFAFGIYAIASRHMKKETS
jgi:hypothetical protein